MNGMPTGDGKEKASLAELDQMLEECCRQLDCVARCINDVNLEPKENIRRIGNAIVELSGIRQRIYERYPDLVPAYLRKQSDSNERK